MNYECCEYIQDNFKGMNYIFVVQQKNKFVVRFLRIAQITKFLGFA